jgi:hypothetical protein
MTTEIQDLAAPPETADAPPVPTEAADMVAPAMVPPSLETVRAPQSMNRRERHQRWLAFLPQIGDDAKARKAEQQRRRELYWQLVEESRFYMGRMLGVSERMDALSYRYKKYEQDWLVSGRRLIEFSHVVMTPEAIYFRVNTARLPANVSVSSLNDEDTLLNLSMACGRAVLCEYSPEKGFWYIVERTSGVRGIPIHVRLDEMWSMRNERHDGLAVPWGIGENKKPVWVSLSDALSVLIGGAPGGGKSNLINVMLCTWIRFNAPHRLKLALVDLKGGLELGRYQDIPHLMFYKPLPLREKNEPLEPVDDSTDPPDQETALVDNTGSTRSPEMRPALVERREDVLPLLRAVYKEGKRRMRLLKAVGARDIGAYNWQVTRSRFLPHLIVVVDELAELRLLSQQDYDNVRKMLISVAQLFRAVGIHLVLATQTPTKQVISLEIRNAIPGRIAFNCPNPTASTLIIGNGRAVGLHPRGRAVLDFGGKLTELQSPLITTTQVDKIIAAALRGEWDDVTLQRHDVTDEEVFRTALEEFDGQLPAEELWKHFRNRQRRIPRDEVRAIIRKYLGKEVMVGSTVYSVVQNFGNRPHYLKVVEEKVEK